VGETSAYDFGKWYVKKQFYVTKHLEKKLPYIDHNEDLLDVFDIPRLYYLPGDVEAYLADKKKEEKEFSNWKVVVNSAFKRAYRKLTSSMQDEIVPCLEAIMLNPMNLTVGKCRPLSNDKKGLWRYRVGNYRILYAPIASKHLIIFVDVTTRDKVYRSVSYSEGNI